MSGGPSCPTLGVLVCVSSGANVRPSIPQLQQIRVGVYQIEEECPGASYAIDAANYAREQLTSSIDGASSEIQTYNEDLKSQRQLESEIRNEICDAFREKRFEIFLQPKYSLATNDVTGAEALVHWRTKDGRLLAPHQFIPLCESAELIKELDFYVFERVAEFLERIIGTIHGLGFHVVCECVETSAQADLLREAGCEEAQGFLFSKPLPIEEYETLVYPKQDQSQK